jgi:hypothetical protein
LKLPLPSVRTLPFLVVWLVVLAMVGAIMSLNEGRFVYTLDDPYIQLTLADRITQGTYGINLDEPVAPSSSALWPLLLAPFGRSIALEWVPLVINVAALFVVIALLDSLLWRGLSDLSRGKRAAGTLLGALVLALCANQFGLVFTGLEHSLSALLALAIFVGILNESESGEAPLWLSLAIVLAPALRYENLAISLPALAFLAWRGHLVRVLVTSIAMIAPLYAFSSFLLSQGLDKFPAGVLATGDPALAAASAPASFAGPDWILIAACVLLAAGIPGSRGRVHPGVWIGVLVAALAQLALGRLGWFGAASQNYMLVVVLAFAALLHGPMLARLIGPRPILAVPLVLALCGLCYPQISSTLLTPIASNNIFEQQYQMYRFRTLVQPVKAAARDVGFVGFRSEGYTLDLAGLTSREVLDVLRTPDKPADWVDALVKKHEIQLVMVPAEWGAQHAGPDWVKIATLSPSRTRVAPTVDTIAFYSVGPGNAERANSVLVDFHRGLPQAQQLLGPDGNPLPRPEPLPEPPPEGEEGALDPNDPNVPFDPNAPPVDPNAPAGAAPAPGAAPAGAPAAQAPGTPAVGARRKLPSPSAVAVDRRGGEGG